jgi:hypothetical protein
MDPTPRSASSWGHDLQQALGGYFTARSRGLLASEFALLGPDGREFGRLRLRGFSAAEFESRDHSAALEASGVGYRMIASYPTGEEILTAAQRERATGEIQLSCSGRAYGARVSLFRNLAVASYPDGERAVRLSGGLIGRSYGATFVAEDGCALPAAVFLLWYLAANRRRAYRLGFPTGGGAT